MAALGAGALPRLEDPGGTDCSGGILNDRCCRCCKLSSNIGSKPAAASPQVHSLGWKILICSATAIFVYENTYDFATRPCQVDVKIFGKNFFI